MDYQVKPSTLINFQNRLILLLATILDIQPYHNNHQSVFHHNKLSLLGSFKIIDYYEQINNKNLSKDVKFYIITSLIDQLYIDMNKEYDTQQLSKFKELQKEQIKNKQNSSFNQREPKNSEKKYKTLNTGKQIFKVFQIIENQYYRELLTYQRVIESFDYSHEQLLTPKEMSFILLDKLDAKQKGHLYFKNLLKAITQIDEGMLENRIKEEQKKTNNNQSLYLQTIKYKLFNNAHCNLKSNSKSIKLLKSNFSELPLHIQNIIQLFYRISQQQKSQTYKFVMKVFKFQEKKQKQKITKDEIQYQNKETHKNKKQIFLAELSHIKDAANQIMRKSRITAKSPSFGCQNEGYQSQNHFEMLQHKLRTPLTSKNKKIDNKELTEVQTYRYQSNFNQNETATYRQNHKNRSICDTHPKIRNFTNQQETLKQKKTFFQSTDQKNASIKQFRIHTKEQIKGRIFKQLKRINEEKIRNRAKYAYIFGL